MAENISHLVFSNMDGKLDKTKMTKQTNKQTNKLPAYEDKKQLIIWKSHPHLNSY